MKYLRIFNKGDKVTINDKYPGLEPMKGDVYRIKSGPANICGTWCYWLMNVAGGIAADALEPIEQTNEEWFANLPTEEKAEFISELRHGMSERVMEIEKIFNDEDLDYEEAVEKWLKAVH